MKKYIQILLCLRLVNLIINIIVLCLFFMAICGFFKYLGMNKPLLRWETNYFIYFYFFFKLNLLVYVINNFVPCLFFYIQMDAIEFIQQQFLNDVKVSNFVTKRNILAFLELLEYVIFTIIAYCLVDVFIFL